MKTFALDPLRDPRWPRFVERHPRASVFHSRGWLEALQRTYGYKPVVHTTASESEELRDGLAFCQIESRLTGRRVVSLPFSDHCEPLVTTEEQCRYLVQSLIANASSRHCKYVETRPLQSSDFVSGNGNGMARSQCFYHDTLDLRLDPADLFRKFHRKSVQQPIRRAERECVITREGRTPELVRQFYQLLIRTRRRHAVPPQPLKWFQNLVDCLDEHVTVRVASKDARPIASIVTLTFKDKVYYKYGCSDERFHSLGGLQLLLWHAISAGKELGAQLLDMGRSDIDQTGLATFKERWGCTRSTLNYYRYPAPDPLRSEPKWAQQALGFAVSRLPDSVLSLVGGILYPHMG